MHKLLITAAAVMAMTGSAYAAEVGGKVELDFAETSAGDWGGTMGVKMDVDAAAGNVALDFKASDGNAITLDKWRVGTDLGGIALDIGDDLGVMPGAEGEHTLAAPAMSEAVRATVGDASVAVGFTDWTADITDISNIQGAYTINLAPISVTAAGDYNMDSENIVLGAGIGGYTLGTVDLSGAVTYDVDAEKFAYETVAGMGGVTAYINGDQDDAMKNIGGEYEYSLADGITATAGANYDIDAEDLAPTVGLSFKF